MKMIRLKKKPDQCPQCGSWRIAEILYGMPPMDARLERDLEAGRIVLGGCVITDHDPTWQCVDCGVLICMET